MKSKSPPAGAMRLTTYEQLRTYATAFAAGHLRTLIVIGSHGVGKSRILHAAVGANAYWFDANASPFGIYCAAFEHLDQPLIMDDVDGLVTDRKGVRLLKSLCQSEVVKRLSWESDAPSLAHRGIPRNFETSSSLALICNSWSNVNADVLAVQDRAHFLSFEPSTSEVHFQARAWFGDQEIFDFVGGHLHFITQHSFRIYTNALELKSAGMDWRAWILSRCLTGPALMVAQLQYNAHCPTAAARVAAFSAAGFGGRSTYFNHLRRLQQQQTVPRLPLLNPARPSDDAARPPGHRSGGAMPARRLLLRRP